MHCPWRGYHGEVQSAKVTEKVTKKVTDKTYGALTESEKKILEIADRLTVSRKTVSQKIKVLKDKGIISRVEAVV